MECLASTEMDIQARTSVTNKPRVLVGTGFRGDQPYLGHLEIDEV
jgi:hypothetical protein